MSGAFGSDCTNIIAFTSKSIAPCVVPGSIGIVLNPEEKGLFGQLFQAADSDKLGIVTGESAVKFFEKSGLGPAILREIWSIADSENQGLLTKVGFNVALRLIGYAQNGQRPRPELAQNRMSP